MRMKAHIPARAVGRAAFTLVELMVVIGLMALLGTVSVTGYFAAVRGMADRAAKQDTVALVRQAMQVCLIDQTPTAVLFFNRQTKAQESQTTSSDEARASSAGAASGYTFAAPKNASQYALAMGSAYRRGSARSSSMRW